MNQQLITQAHPVDGHFQIQQKDELIVVDCRWPFDIENNDWIEIKNDFSLQDYSQAVNAAISGGRGEAAGIKGGFITIEQSGPRQTTVEVSNSAKGWLGRSLRMRIAKPVASFIGSE